MNRSAAVARVQRTLGFRTDRANDIIELLQDAQATHEQGVVLPWFLISETSSIETIAGEERVTVPGDFLRGYDDDALWYYNGGATLDEDKWIELEKTDMEYLRTNLPGTGAPRGYSLTGDYLRIFPTPDSNYTLKFIYYREAAKLTSDIENDWLKHYPYVLIGHAGRNLAGAMRDERAVKVFDSQYKEAFTLMQLAVEARQHENQRYAMGGLAD